MSAQVSFTLSGALTGMRRTLPLAASDFTVGIVFGVLARRAGLDTFQAVLMSALVSAGTSQFIALGMWFTPLPALQIVLTTLVINLRHVLFGAALHPYFSRLSAARAYTSMFFMTDETWAMAMSEFAAGSREAAFMAGSGALLVVTWVSGTFIGAIGGGFIPDPALLGLDFVFVTVMIALLAGMWKSRGDLLPWTVAALVAVLASLWLPGKWYILLGGVAGSIAGVITDERKGRELPLGVVTQEVLGPRQRDATH